MKTMKDGVLEHAKQIKKLGTSTVTIFDLVDVPHDGDFYALANCYGTALLIINELTRKLEERELK
jgi:hypothetical protein